MENRTAVGFQEIWSQKYSAGGGPITAAVSQRIASILAWIFLKTNASPNAITVAGGCVSIFGAILYVLFPIGGIYSTLCLIIYQLGYCLDCADGQVARASKKSTEFGAWLDVVVDVVTQLVQVFAILYWLGGVAGSLGIQLVAAIVSLSTGRILVVITGKYTSHHRRTEKAGVSKSKIKLFVFGILDTPVLLACFTLLRDYPSILMWYVFFMGVAYSANAFYLAWKRLYLCADRP